MAETKRMTAEQVGTYPTDVDGFLNLSDSEVLVALANSRGTRQRN